ncbi:hypothetical protein EVAR_46642_1 [Eumeta japonica]|uniref:Uncharacterized protein n=1 Tax=Eumeta variegata TaxID=151549 RepID=A0A4C1WGQ4_EUMVA|nr:hypothetical protein EVAR_46642_1 [Eumeta japonica]
MWLELPLTYSRSPTFRQDREKAEPLKVAETDRLYPRLRKLCLGRIARGAGSTKPYDGASTFDRAEPQLPRPRGAVRTCRANAANGEVAHFSFAYDER